MPAKDSRSMLELLEEESEPVEVEEVAVLDDELAVVEGPSTRRPLLVAAACPESDEDCCRRSIVTVGRSRRRSWFRAVANVTRAFCA